MDKKRTEAFSGSNAAQHVVNYLPILAEKARAMVAELGFRYMDDTIGSISPLESRRLDSGEPIPRQPLIRLQVRVSGATAA